MDRRNFLKRGLNKVGEVLVNTVDARARDRARRWIRPPFALDELEFLTTCTRCDACIDACPHQTIFPLTARLGATVIGTPALDLTNNACQLCPDWPCVTACKAAALELPKLAESVEQEQQPAEQEPEVTGPLPSPKLAHAQIDQTRCLPYLGPDCGVCRDACPVTGAMTWTLGRPLINPDVCVGCAQCRQVCVAEPKAVTIRSLAAAINTS